MEEVIPELKEVTIKFGRGLVGKPFTSKTGKELVEIQIPNANPADKRPWESFLVESKLIHDNKFGKGVWMTIPDNGKIQLSRSAKVGVDEIGKSIWKRESRTVTGGELKAMMEKYKARKRAMER